MDKLLHNVLVVTQAGMIFEDDLEPLKVFANVDYIERETIELEKLAELSTNYDCLMLNYDVVSKTFSSEFYHRVKGTRLKMISCDITGMSWAFPDVAKQNGIVLCNTPNYCTDSVSEHILAQMLLHSRKIHKAYVDAFLNKCKRIPVYKGFNLKGKTIGILGAGNIGLRLAELTQGIGMHPLLWNYRPKNTKFEMVDIDTLCDCSDVLAICVKTTPETLGMIDCTFFSKCKKNCIIINQAGEQLINHNDLYDFLQKNVDAGYSGTLSIEILNSPIYNLHNATFQPPNAWFSDESLAELRRTWVNNVVSFFKGGENNYVYE